MSNASALVLEYCQGKAQKGFMKEPCTKEQNQLAK